MNPYGILCRENTLAKMKSHSLTIGKQLPVRGRTVRNIIEQNPGQISEVWCRKIYRHLLHSLERQYSMQLPHRPITPDTVVIDNDGTPHLLATISDTAPDVSRDMTALAKLIHFAITQEPASAGPLRGRRLQGYSKSLISAVDRSMSPLSSERPRSIEELRDILGIVVFERALPYQAATRAPHLNAPDARAKQMLPRLTSALQVLTSLRRRVVFAVSMTAALGIGLTAAFNMRALTPPAMNAAPRPAIDDRPLVHKDGEALMDAKPSIPASEPVNPGSEAVVENDIQAESSDAKTLNNGRPVAIHAPDKRAARTRTRTDEERARSVPTLAPVVPPAILRLPKTDATDVVAASAAHAGTPTSDAESANVVLNLQIRPWGVVYVDGVNRGVSPPMKKLAVTPGHHSIRIDNSNSTQRMLEVDTAQNSSQISIDFNKDRH